MTYRVFLDTNILMDVLVEREPFFLKSQQVLTEIRKLHFTPYLSGSSITDLYYICRKAGVKRGIILEYLKDLMKNFEVLIIDKESINQAIESGIKDFEDAVQILACKNGNIDLIVTRNKSDFENDWIEVCTPQEFLANFIKEG